MRPFFIFSAMQAEEVARFLGVTTWAVVRAAHAESHIEIEKYL